MQSITDADISIYPDSTEKNLGSVTIGDLHGNALKLVYFLLRWSVIRFKEGNDFNTIYNSFVTIYNQSAKLKDEASEVYSSRVKLTLEGFNTFISNLEIVSPKLLVRLIGDELADRGSNDYFTLRLLGFLHDNNVKVNILASNHSNEFIYAYEGLLNGHVFEPINCIKKDFKRSFDGLQCLMTDPEVETEVIGLVNKAYKPCLKIIDYTLGADCITLYTHAPVDFSVIKKLANKMLVVYNDTTKEALAVTIDKINTIFAEYVQRNTVSELYPEYEQYNNFSNDLMSDDQISRSPLTYIISHRYVKNALVQDPKDTVEARPVRVNDFNVFYTHGHDAYQSEHKHVMNIDTPFGMYSAVDYNAQSNVVSARQALVENPQDIEANKFIDAPKVIKVINSSDIALSAIYSAQFIRLEHYLTTNEKGKRAAIIATLVGIGLFLGIAIGALLVATGVFAPFGIGIWAAVAFAATTGGGLATIFVAFGFAVGVIKTIDESVVTENLDLTEDDSMQPSGCNS